MTKTSTNTWLSAHLFHNDSLDRLLGVGLQPFFDRLQASDEVESFFFIRYWVGGPHLRIRVLASEDVLEQKIKPLLESCVTDYFEETTSAPAINEEMYKMYSQEMSRLENVEKVDISQMFHANTLHYIPYEQEIVRYGGPYGIKIAEAWFNASSVLVLELLPLIADNELQHFQWAFLSFAVFVYEMRGTNRDKIRFCRLYHEYWSKYIPEQVANLVNHRALEDFRRQEQILSRMTQLAFKESGDSVDWLEGFRNEVRTVLQMFYEAAESGMLVWQEGEENDSVNHYSILASYLHMHNNRLGVGPHVEAISALYLAILIEEGGIQS